MQSKDKGFLVRASVALIGGHEFEEVDAFRAETPEEAESYAFNTFLIGSSMILYGRRGFVADTICSIRVVAYEEIDLAAPENEDWLKSADIFERFMEEQNAPKEIDRHFSSSTGIGNE